MSVYQFLNFNDKMKIQDRIKESECFYLRETNGTAYQVAFHPNVILQVLLSEIFCSKSLKMLKLISQGKQLELKISLAQNKLQPNSIVHLIPQERPEQQRGYVYLNYDHKIHRIQFRMQQYIESFKWKVREETGVPVHSQLILFNSVPLEDQKTLQFYEIRTGDFLCMAKNEPLYPILLESPRVIYPSKANKKRSQSERQLSVVATPLTKPSNNVHFCRSVQNNMDQNFTSNLLSQLNDFGLQSQHSNSQYQFKQNTEKQAYTQLPTQHTLKAQQKQSKIAINNLYNLDASLSIVNEICYSKMDFEHLSNNSDAMNTHQTQPKQSRSKQYKLNQLEDQISVNSQNNQLFNWK